MLSDFNNLPDSSRIWIYASENFLSANQQEIIINSISELLEGWNAHGLPLFAGVSILENHFIVVALDESKNRASGCSIDTLQNKIQQIEKDLSVSLLNRLNIFCKLNDKIQAVPLHKISTIARSETLFYDLTVQKKSDLNSWLKAISMGWCSNLL